MLSWKALSCTPQRARVSPAASPIPTKLKNTSMHLGSCSSIKRSRSITTSAVTSSCAVGRSGVKSTSIALTLQHCLRVMVHGYRSDVDGGLHPIQKRLRIDPHENDQREDRREHDSFPNTEILKLLVVRIG